MTEAVCIDGLWWRYPTYSDEANPWVLRDVNLKVEQGTCFGITGPGGVGKTTLCRAMLGIIPHNARLTAEQLPHHFRGSVAVCGEAVTAKTPVSNSIGMVLQDPENQFLRMSLLHELALGLQIRGVPNEEIVERTHEALAMVGLEHLWHGAAYLHPADLSGGQKQRVAIAAFLALRPCVLVLDEPTSDLDPAGKREIIKTIARLRQQEQMTIVLVEQDPDILATFCDTIALLHEGRVEMVAPPAEFYARRDLLERSGASVGELPRISWYSGHTFEERPPLTIEEGVEAFGEVLMMGQIDADTESVSPAIEKEEGTDARKGPLPTSTQKEEGTDARKGPLPTSTQKEEGTDARKGPPPTSTQKEEGTDARKGPPPTSTQPPSLLCPKDAPSGEGENRNIVGTGAVGPGGVAPCGRPSGSTSEDEGVAPCGRPSGSIGEDEGVAPCGRPSGSIGEDKGVAPCGRPSVSYLQEEEETSSVRPSGSHGHPRVNKSELIITAENVGYRYADGTEALRGIDATVNRGEMLALLGPNGSGKTTFAKIVAGIYRATDGRVEVLGQDLAKRRVRARLPRSVGYVFQNPDHQLFRRKVSDEIAYGLKNLGMDASRRRVVIEETLEAVDLARYADEDPLFLSKGQRQRLAVAAVLAMGPEVLIVDEPTTGQDYRSVQAIMRLLRNLQRQGKTIVIITHDMSLVADYCQRVLAFRDGSVAFTGTPRELFGRAELLQRTGLRQPTSAALSTRLREQNPDAPFLMTVEEWVKALS